MSSKATPRCHVAPPLRKHLVPLGELSQDPANLRLHGERSIEALKASLRRFGQQKPIVFDHTGVVVAGNGTLEAARQLEWTHIAAVRSDLAGVERVAYSIADNRIAELSEWDDPALSRVLAALPPEDVAAIGFTAKELDELAIENRPITEDEVPLPPDEATTRPGDLWILGAHRLLCGDSSDRAAVDRLLGGAKVQLVNTDPPYNVKVEPRSNNAIAAGLSSSQRRDASAGDQQSADLHRYPEKSKATHKKLRPKDRPLANDFVTDEAFAVMLLAWFGNAAHALVPGGGFYIWGGYANVANYPPALVASGLYFSQAIIWDKQHPVLTRKDYMGAHEWCFYGWREGGPHRFFGPANASDLWAIKKVNPNAMVHLTEKPVELAARAIQNSSRPGERVLDLFGGSGSTLVACEQTGRSACLMELDPLYCDVIIERWQKLTGQTASLDGAAWATVGQRRKASPSKEPACPASRQDPVSTPAAEPSAAASDTAPATPSSTNPSRGKPRRKAPRPAGTARAGASSAK